jgi:O-methyltransferase involved in polyketide biosynthesis
VTSPRADASTLTGVSETALLTLLVRATEARRADSIIDDPVAIDLVDSIDFDFGKFGFANRQDMALRALAFDRETGAYLRSHPDATVVALAEGLQTSFYRLNASGISDTFRWHTVDLPPIVALRDALLPSSERVSTSAQSALDYSWMDDVDDSHGVFITAEGLLMYLQPTEAIALITECAKRFPGGQMMFDLPPYWFAWWARQGLLRPSLRYRVPPMPFSLSVGQAADLANTIAGVRAVHDVEVPTGRGRVLNALIWASYRVPVIDQLRGVTTRLEFG